MKVLPIKLRSPLASLLTPSPISLVSEETRVFCPLFVHIQHTYTLVCTVIYNFYKIYNIELDFFIVMVSYISTLVFFSAKCVWEIYYNDTYPVLPFKCSVTSPFMISPYFIHFHSVGPRGYFHI